MRGAELLTISAEIDEIPKVSAVLEGLMQAHAFSEEAILDTQLAVEEAVTNSIVHGYEGRAGKVTVAFRITRSLAEIQIEDDAAPFNPLSIPEPEIDGDLEERRIGGLGVFLIRQVMDEVVYRHENGRNILSLLKKKKD